MYRVKLIEKLAEKAKRAEGISSVKEKVRKAYDEGIRMMINKDSNQKHNSRANG